MSSEKELTMWIDADLAEAAEEYVRKHTTTLQTLISEFLRQLANAQPATPPSTVLDRLTGILPSEASRSEHRESLARKFLDHE